MTSVAIKVMVNGDMYERQVPYRLTLGDFLRHDLGLKGTHFGCEHGVCGACTVLVDGVSARSCLMLAAQSDGCSITTIEGLAAKDGTLNPLQAAFHEYHGLQCGFCTPGMLMTLTELLSETLTPSEDEIRDAISGNICRCTGYQSIVEATQAVARRMGEKP